MSQKQVKRTKAEADGLVAAYEASGMTRRKFCASVGMSPHTLDHYPAANAANITNGCYAQQFGVLCHK